MWDLGYDQQQNMYNLRKQKSDFKLYNKHTWTQEEGFGAEWLRGDPVERRLVGIFLSGKKRKIYLFEKYPFVIFWEPTSYQFVHYPIEKFSFNPSFL
jgi:hypothetical protein